MITMKYRVRRYKPEDAAKIDEIYERCHGHFNLPSIKHCLDLAVVEKGDKIVALGAFQLIPELVLVMDNELPKRDQVIALRELLAAGETLARINDFGQVYAFADSNNFENILENHFGFEKCSPILIKKIPSIKED